MKKKLTALIASFLAFTTLGVLSACSGNGDNSSTPADSTPPISTPDDSTPGGEYEDEMDCRVTVRSEGGMALYDVAVKVYDQDNNLVKQVKTNGRGVAELFLETGEYKLKLGDLPLGYYSMGSSYTLSASNPDIAITVGIEDIGYVTEEDRAGHIYKVGDVVHDFELQTMDGETLTLSEMLEEKEMVMLNFWYLNCAPCLSEMPELNNAYFDERYNGKFELIGIHHNYGYSLKNVQDFLAGTHADYPSNWKDAEFTLDFPISYYGNGMSDIQNYFTIEGYPTTVVIDRYGVVAYLVTGSFEGQVEVNQRIGKYLGEDYVQDFSNSGEDVIIDGNPPVEPTVPDPTADELNAALDVNVTDLEYRVDPGQYVWPFVATEKDGRECIYAPNTLAGLSSPNTSSILYIDVNVPEVGYQDNVFTFDYKVSSEEGGDYFYVLVDGVLMFSASGESDWTTCRAYVPAKGGKHTLAFTYTKDGTYTEADDTVYISNLRFEPLGEEPAVVFRHAATERLSDADGYKTLSNPVETEPRFANYAPIVFNETDGLYHVRTVDGPILLANLMDTATQWSMYALYDYAVSGYFIYELDGFVGDLKETLEQYANAENHSDNGYVPVNAELASILQFIAEEFGSGLENEWLEMCCYYDVYNTEEVKNPCEGVHFYYAIDIEMDYSMANPEARAVVDIQKMIMPRGYKYTFTPERTGVYAISSDRSIARDPGAMSPIIWMTNGEFVFNEDGAVVFAYEAGGYGDFRITARLQAGVTYHIAAADVDDKFFGDKYELVIKFQGGEQVQEFTFCAEPPFYTSTDENGNDTAQTYAEGIAYATDDDGYLRALNANGTLGSYIYVNMTSETTILPVSLQQVLAGNIFDDTTLQSIDFNFTGLVYDSNYDGVADSPVVDANGNSYGDCTEIMNGYLEEALATTGELFGYVKVTAELQDLLRVFTIKLYGDETLNAWQCMCYYYKTI